MIVRLGQRQQISREIKNVLPLPETLRNMPRSKAANDPRNQECVASAGDPKKRASVKGSIYPEKSRMCCLCQRPEERASVKGSKYLEKSRVCCLCQRPEETRLGQRQQMSREIKSLLPLPETFRNAPRSKAANIPRIKNVLPLPESFRNAPRSKAANIPRNQEYVAFAGDLQKRASVKGSKYPEKSRKCCLC